MKKLKIIILSIYLFILILTLCGCSNKEGNEGIDQKIESEIEYLDKTLVGIMNKLNNITLENYEVKSKEISSKTDKQGEEKQEGDNASSQQSASSGGASSGEEANGGASSSEGSSSEENSTSVKVLQMQPSNILVINKNEIDWMPIKSEVEIMYSAWNSIILDLYSMDIANENILGFSQGLDNAILAAKSEDKQKSLEALANLYSYLPKFIENISIEESTKNILRTKANIMQAYAFVEQENWTEIQNQMEQADANYSKVANDVKYIENKQGEVSKIYILIKELKNSINLKDKDVFYIKYKNFMNSID